MGFLSADELRRIELKIAAAEMLTSAEFKIIITKHAWFGLKKKAIRLFKKYHLHKTENRNAVLILIVEKDQQLLIYGDEGIHSKVGTAHWEAIRDAMLDHFKQGKYADGLALGIFLLADCLAEHFPANRDQYNRLSNEIIFES
jgi:uncharacterized membrane protein